MDWYEHPLDPRHVGVPSGGSKMISEPIVRLVQTMHLSCTNINTISKQTENELHLTHGTKEFPWVRLKRFLSLLYIRHKLCTYLVSRLTLPPNRSKWASLDPHHLGVWSDVPKMICEPKEHRHKPWTHLVLRLTLSPNGPKQASTWPMSCRSTIRCVQNDFPAYGTFSGNQACILHQD
jgi:hypothetical protein